jgi:hypothetical protein
VDILDRKIGLGGIGYIADGANELDIAASPGTISIIEVRPTTRKKASQAFSATRV